MHHTRTQEGRGRRAFLHFGVRVIVGLLAAGQACLFAQKGRQLECLQVMEEQKLGRVLMTRRR
jgi:hypothetical protein